MESPEVSNQKKEELKRIYQSLNPAELKRAIDQKLKSFSVRNYIAQPKPISVR